MTSLKQWIKTGNGIIPKAVRALWYSSRNFSFPVIPVVHSMLYRMFVMVRAFSADIFRVLWWTPLFKSQLISKPKRLMLYGGMPLLLGPLRIRVGENCRINGVATFAGRSAGNDPVELIVGDNVDLSWQNGIFVGRRIEIGNNVRLAVKCRLIGYPGHPMNPEDRAAGLPDTSDQIGDIILEDDVWLGAGVTVLPGVRIGRGTVVATGSIVTKDLPPMVLAAGAPARVMRNLTDGDIRDAA